MSPDAALPFCCHQHGFNAVSVILLYIGGGHLRRPVLCWPAFQQTLQVERVQPPKDFAEPSMVSRGLPCLSTWRQERPTSQHLIAVIPACISQLNKQMRSKVMASRRCKCALSHSPRHCSQPARQAAKTRQGALTLLRTLPGASVWSGSAQAELSLLRAEV